jgi:outer membrane protein, heavy metal efflux system
MRTTRAVALLAAVAAIVAVALPLARTAAAQIQSKGSQSPQSATPALQTAAPALRMEDFEQMALLHNPVVTQGAARIRAAAGRTQQAGLYPNPVVGYTGEEIGSDPFTRGGEQGFFVQQEIPLGGVLSHGRRVGAQAETETRARVEMEKARVLNSVDQLFYRALGAQRRLEVREQLAEIAHDAEGTAKQLANVGQADVPDVLEAEVEAERADVALESSRNERDSVWRELAAVVGVPTLAPAPLTGSLDDAPPPLEFESALEKIVQESPEVALAQAGVTRADETIALDRARRIPSLLVRGGIRDNRELLPTNRPTGIQGFAEIGIAIPIFDRKQGEIAAAKGEAEAARLGVEREKLSLRMRLARAYRIYRDSRRSAEKYRVEILPRAQKAYDLYSRSYSEMTAAYPQVLIAQRNLAQAELDYVAAAENLWLAATEIRCMLVGTDAAEAMMESAP